MYLLGIKKKKSVTVNALVGSVINAPLVSEARRQQTDASLYLSPKEKLKGGTKMEPGGPTRF